MKCRIISFLEVEERVMDLTVELESSPLDEESIIQNAQQLLLSLSLCISQMQGVRSKSYPDKSRHYEILTTASKSITYKINTCTLDEIRSQVNAASKAFRVQ